MSNNKYVKCYAGNEFIREVPIVEGGYYAVEPANPRAKKYRSEKVVLIGLTETSSAECLRVESQWHVKRKSYTMIDICDLRFLLEKPPADVIHLLD
jgi:hypothetical protein